MNIVSLAANKMSSPRFSSEIANPVINLQQQVNRLSHTVEQQNMLIKMLTDRTPQTDRGPKPYIKTGVKLGALYSGATLGIAMGLLGALYLFNGGPLMAKAWEESMQLIARKGGKSVEEIARKYTLKKMVPKIIGKQVVRLIKNTVFGGFIGYGFYQLQKAK